MADNVENLLLRITAEDDATDELTGLAAALAAIDHADATPEIEVGGIVGATAELTGFAAACKALDDTEISPDVDLTQLELFGKALDGLATRTFSGKFMKEAAGAFAPFADFGEQTQLDLQVDTTEVEQAQVELEGFVALLAADELVQPVEIDVEVQFQEASAGIALIKAQLALLGADTTEVDVKVQKEGFERDLAGLQERLVAVQGIMQEVGAQVIHPGIELEEGKVLAQIATIENKLDDLTKTRQIDIEAYRAPLQAELAALQAKLDEIEANHPEITLDVDDQRLARIQAEVAAFEADSAEKTLNLDTSEATMELAGFRAALLGLPDPEIDMEVNLPQMELFAQAADEATRSFKGRFMKDVMGDFTTAFQEQMKMFSDEEFTTTVDVEVDGIAESSAQLALFAAEAAALDGKDVTVDVNVDRKGMISQAAGAISGLLSSLAGAASGLASFAGEGTALGGAFAKVGEQLAGVTVNLGAFGARLGPIIAGVIVLIAIIGTALVGAFALLGVAIGGAIVFAGGLAIALGGALLPAVAALIPVFLAFQAVLGVIAAEQQEATHATEEAAQAHRDAVLYARQHADAERNLADALRGFADAQKSSAQGIADAHRDEQSAVERLASATVAAYREMEDAIEAASDAVLTFQRAQLTSERADLNIKLAKDALKDFRKEMGLAGKDFDASFKEFEDTGFDPTKLNKALASIKPGKELKGDDQLKLQGLILDVKDANLRKKEAIDGVDDATRNLNRTEEKAAQFQREGIAASEQYQSALKGVADARRAVARAHETGSAREAAASRAVADARRQLSRLENDRVYQKQHGNVKKSTELTKNLSKEELHLLNSVKRVWKELKRAFGPATATIIDAIADGLISMRPTIDAMRGPLKTLGKAFGQAIGDFFKLLASPEVRDSFITLITSAAQLAPLIGSVFGSLLKILLRIAVAAMPFLIEGMKALDAFLKGFANDNGVSTFADLFEKMRPLFTKLLGLGLKLGEIILQFLVDAAPYAGQFLDLLTQLADQFLTWLQSDEGQAELQYFFETVIPLVMKLAQFLGPLILFFLRLTEALGPLVGIFFDVLTVVFDLLNTFTLLAGVIVNALGQAFGWLTGALASLVGTITGFIDKFGLAGANLIGGLIKGIEDKAGDLWEAFKGFFSGIWDKITGWWGVSSPSTKMIELAGEIIQGLIDGITSLATTVWNAFKSLFKIDIAAIVTKFYNYGVKAVNGIINGIKSIASKVWNAISGLFDGFDFTAIITKFFDLGKDIVTGLINGIKGLPGAVLHAGEDLAKGAWEGAKDFLHMGSPSKLFYDVGVDVGKGFELGVKASGDKARIGARFNPEVATSVDLLQFQPRARALV
jgi:phage-related protein